MQLKPELGEDYIHALEEVVKVRDSRCAQYGNTYMGDDYLFLKYQVENKMKRLGLQINHIKNQESIADHRVALDSAIDAANYAIFIVAKLLKEQEPKF
jgi:hypothetical protein